MFSLRKLLTAIFQIILHIFDLIVIFKNDY